MKHSYFSIGAGLAGSLLFALTAHAAAAPLELTILSADTLNGTAGDYVTIDAQVKNTTAAPLQNITTYLTLVDTENKLPVDLEDWSAEKGRFIGSIDVGQTLPLSWKIHFVKAGSYNLAIVANVAGNTTPQISTFTHFNVLPKRNLNPGHVLPVALITPLLLIFVLFALNFRRKIAA